MAIYDYDGSASHEIGFLYDYDGSASHQIKEVYDYDGSASHLVYNAEKDIYNNGAVYDGGSWGSVSGNYDAGSGYTMYLQANTDYADPNSTSNTRLMVAGKNLWGPEVHGGRLITTSTVNLSGYSYINFQFDLATTGWYATVCGPMSSRNSNNPDSAFVTSCRFDYNQSGNVNDTVITCGTAGLSSAYIGVTISGTAYNNSALYYFKRIWLS